MNIEIIKQSVTNNIKAVNTKWVVSNNGLDVYTADATFTEIATFMDKATAQYVVDLHNSTIQ